MKKKVCLILTLVSSLMILSACSETKNLDVEENAVIAQYIAGSVLKYDINYSEGLVYDYQKEKDDTITLKLDNTNSTNDKVKDPVAKPVVDITKNDTTSEDTSKDDAKDQVANCNLSDIYNKNIKVSYKDYKLCSSYSGSYNKDAGNVQAKTGNQLLVLRFTLKNSSKKSQRVKLIRSGISYELKIGEKSFYPILSIVSNDIQYFNSTIKGNQSKSAVLIFELPKKETIKNSILTITNIDKVSLVTVK